MLLKETLLPESQDPSNDDQEQVKPGIKVHISNVEVSLDLTSP